MPVPSAERRINVRIHDNILIKIQSLNISEALARTKEREKTESSPLGQHRHDGYAGRHTGIGSQLDAELGIPHFRVEHELVGQKLHHGRVDEDAGADGVKDAVDELRHGRVRSQAAVDAEANGDAGRGGDA